MADNIMQSLKIIAKLSKNNSQKEDTKTRCNDLIELLEIHNIIYMDLTKKRSEELKKIKIINSLSNVTTNSLKQKENMVDSG